MHVACSTLNKACITNLSTSESLFFFQRDGRQSSCQGRSEDGTDADTNHNPKDGEESTQD